MTAGRAPAWGERVHFGFFPLGEVNCVVYPSGRAIASGGGLEPGGKDGARWGRRTNHV